MEPRADVPPPPGPSQKWIMRVLGVTEDAFVREVIFVDPVQRITTMVSVNLSLSQYVSVARLGPQLAPPHLIPRPQPMPRTHLL